MEFIIGRKYKPRNEDVVYGSRTVFSDHMKTEWEREKSAKLLHFYFEEGDFNYVKISFEKISYGTTFFYNIDDFVSDDVEEKFEKLLAND